MHLVANTRDDAASRFGAFDSVLDLGGVSRCGKLLEEAQVGVSSFFHGVAFGYGN